MINARNISKQTTLPGKRHKKKNVKIGMKMNNDNFLYQGML